MDAENATTCRVPRSHADVAAKVDTFARYAKHQYDDAVVLLAALAGHLKSANNTYAQYDQRVFRAPVPRWTPSPRWATTS
ncbi:hypothetical protein [Streptomyces vastus]